MKLQIISTVKQGLEVIIKNPTILTIIILNALLSCIYIYFFVYAPGFAELASIPEHFWLTIIFTLISMFLNLITTKMVYDAAKDNRVSLSEAINLSLRRYIFVFIATILFFLIVALGLIALIIPGIFLFIKFVFVTYPILLNNEGIINSFEKNWQITKGNWWRIFGFLLILLIPIIILSIIATIIAEKNVVQIALVFDFTSSLLAGWFISASTIAYIHLTQEMTIEKE